MDREQRSLEHALHPNLQDVEEEHGGHLHRAAPHAQCGRNGRTCHRDPTIPDLGLLRYERGGTAAKEEWHRPDGREHL